MATLVGPMYVGTLPRAIGAHWGPFLKAKKCEGIICVGIVLSTKMGHTPGTFSQLSVK